MKAVALLGAAMALTGCGYVGTVERDMYTAHVDVRPDFSSGSMVCSAGRAGKTYLFGGPRFAYGTHNRGEMKVQSAELVNPRGLEVLQTQAVTLQPDTYMILVDYPKALQRSEYAKSFTVFSPDDPLVLRPSDEQYQVTLTARTAAREAGADGMLIRYRINGRQFEDHYMQDMQFGDC